MAIMPYDPDKRFRHRRFIIFSAISVLFVIFFLHLANTGATDHVKSYIHNVSSSFHSDSPSKLHDYTPSPPQEHDHLTKDDKSIATILQWIYDPLKIDVAAPYFKDPADGELHYIPPMSTWTAPLGKRICFVDIDTRKFEGEHELITDPSTPEDEQTGFDFGQLQPYPAGMLAHYAYTLIHGYDYKYIRTNNYDDRAPFWTKPGAVASVLQDYDFVISIDADATIAHPEIPFEWLLNRWKITKDTAISIAKEPGNPRDFDENGRLMDNGGFVIAQNIPRAHEILKAWSSCPDEPSLHYSNCSHWKEPFPAEQAAFSQYITTAYTKPTDINEIQCDDANGSWGFWQSFEFPVFCKGRFISHFTLTKDKLKEGIGRQWAGGLFHHLHARFNEEKDERVIERTTNVFPEYEN